jgi:2',3'-cyclic-nucleotide 2'-phosphodiesterase (5'-nucleotidase family)
MQHDVCSHRAQTFCAVKDRRPTYFGFPVVPDTKVARVIEDAKSRVASLAETKIATAQEPLQRRSDGESAMSNLLADALRSATGADLALVNTLGIRAGFPAGKVTYRDLFAVSPFNNRAVLMGPASTRQVIDILEASLQEMGSPGYLIPSGVRLKYRGTLDTPSARLVLLTLPDGSVLFDDAKGVLVERTFTIATYDYLAGGVSGNAALAGIPVLKNDTGIARELIATELQKRRQALSNTLDGRFGAE